MQCAEFEALLMEALDGELSEERQAGFEAHRRSCALCGPMFTDVEAGRMWLRSLEPVEAPPYLVHNILAATSGVVGTGLATAPTGSIQPFRGRFRTWWESWFRPFEAFVRQPRFVMSFGMIFFTFSLVVSAAGVKPADVSKIDLRPAAIRHAYNDAQIKVIHYYDNIRFVYEIESKVRELKRATAPAEPAPAQKKENNDNTSGQPEQRQDRNYSREQNETVLAALSGTPDEVHDCELRTVSYEQTLAHSPQAAKSVLTGDPEFGARSSKAPVVAMDRRYL
jgi:Putative zinc-finger